LINGVFTMLFRNATVPTAEFEQKSGWVFKPEGACKGDVCIPLAQMPDESLDLQAITTALGLPMLVDEQHGLYAVGPESIGARALVSAQAPNLVLPDVDGNDFDLASLRGQKVMVYAWAPY
jgi:hypothetical protein